MARSFLDTLLRDLESPIEARGFATCYFPDSFWPKGYGVPERVPSGDVTPLGHPFVRKAE